MKGEEVATDSRAFVPFDAQQALSNWDRSPYFPFKGEKMKTLRRAAALGLAALFILIVVASPATSTAAPAAELEPRAWLPIIAKNEPKAPCVPGFMSVHSYRIVPGVERIDVGIHVELCGQDLKVQILNCTLEGVLPTEGWIPCPPGRCQGGRWVNPPSEFFWLQIARSPGYDITEITLVIPGSPEFTEVYDWTSCTSAP
ncbi:hypothetical protein A3H21_01230 [Candidatus Woesebacteria bacterium RIFCSPLOWO2_12_FULL_42_8]|nr:MAG: hypothetical protein A3H21_01230 [Candidatus Woesebacteria bacterium RIFCSPLOWO2_12_FULL_42_8]